MSDLGKGKTERMGSFGNAPELMKQLAAMLEQAQDPAARLTDLETRVEALASRVGSGSGNQDLAGTIKKIVSSVLLESGFLEKLIDRRLAERLGGADAATGLAKEIRGAVQKEIEGYLASDSIKELLDEKFRAVTLYLKTDVIPQAVRQALRDRTPA